MDDRTRVLLDRAVDEHLVAHGEVPPPWKAYPEIERFSIGWRMGSGEWHLMMWWHWWEPAHPDEAARIAYFRTNPPPTEWLDWAAAAVWPDVDLDDETGCADAVRRLAAHRIGDYVAWRTWLEGEEQPGASTGG